MEIEDAWAALSDAADSDAMEAAIDLLVRTYAPLAGYLARRATAKAPAYQDPDDLMSYAYQGLLDSIRLFEPSVGVKFETYATRRISGAIMDGQRRQDPLARGTRQTVKAMQVAIDHLWEKHDRDPSLAEIAVEMGETEDIVRATLLAQKSLNSSLDAETTAPETLSVTAGAEISSQLVEARDRVATKLASLAPQQRAFVLAYYVDQLTLRATAQTLKISNLGCRDTRDSVLDRLTA